jgi:hypothetical protein
MGCEFRRMATVASGRRRQIAPSSDPTVITLSVDNAFRLVAFAKQVSRGTWGQASISRAQTIGPFLERCPQRLPLVAIICHPPVQIGFRADHTSVNRQRSRPAQVIWIDIEQRAHRFSTAFHFAGVRFETESDGASRCLASEQAPEKSPKSRTGCRREGDSNCQCHEGLLRRKPGRI